MRVIFSALGEDGVEVHTEDVPIYIPSGVVAPTRQDLIVQAVMNSDAYIDFCRLHPEEEYFSYDIEVGDILRIQVTRTQG